MDEGSGMKTYKNLFNRIICFENLLLAAYKAEKGKRWDKPVWKFRIELEKNLLSIQRDLRKGSYRPGEYQSFQIFDPKPRMISAAPFRDRVVHHALCNIIEPILDKSLIYDTYANRKGKGTHKAILRYQEYARKYDYVLKADIQNFFPSIDHLILKDILRQKIVCQKTLRLIDLLIDGSNSQESKLFYFPGDDLFTPMYRRKGLPIGNLTSQLWGNYYLSPLDHFVKTELRCKGYVRYVDDFVLLHNEKSVLHEWKKSIEKYLEGLRLKIHPDKTQVTPVSKGLGFLGHFVYPDYRLLKKSNVRRFRKRTNKRLGKIKKGTLALPKFEEQLTSWVGHASFSRTYHLQLKIFSEIEGQGIGLKNARRVARRLLEQQQ